MIIVIRKCAECPMMRNREQGEVCAVSTPKERPIPEVAQRPNWCPLRREQIIVREFK
jgi:hypothetical protein